MELGTATSRPSRDTTQPSKAVPVLTPLRPLRQLEPEVGEIFNLRIKGKVYEAMKKTDGKVYILQEVK